MAQVIQEGKEVVVATHLYYSVFASHIPAMVAEECVRNDKFENTLPSCLLDTVDGKGYLVI